MGRPREHDEATAAALRTAAERLVAEGGAGALSVRAVADAAGTTTRAVYSIFGSKDGLVDALAQTTFELLYREIGARPETDDPVADLVDLAVNVVRRLALDHPALYRIAFQRVIPGLRAGAALTAARERAFTQLQEKMGRAGQAGLLGSTSIRDSTIAFEAMMEGLANAELRGRTLPILPLGEEEQAWHRALRSLFRGFRADAGNES